MSRQDRIWSTPPRAYYSTLANLVGLQVLRALSYEIKLRVRRSLLGYRDAPDVWARELADQGVVAIPNFLEEDTYAAVREFYYSELSRHPVPQNKGPKLVAPVLCHPKRGTAPDIVRRAFIDNEQLNRIIEYCSAHRQNILPLIRLHHYEVSDEDIEIREDAKTDELHYDVPLCNLRAFFYLESCDRRSAAFEYAKGTHCLTAARLRVEYHDSIVQSRARQGHPGAKVQPIRDELLKSLSADPRPLEAAGNTLVIFNTMGLHRRGRFASAGSRECILIDYRYLDAKANYRRYRGALRFMNP